jgi:predicted aspartyl protease
MGKVITKVKLANWEDIALAAAGTKAGPPRRAEPEALVDTGAVFLYLRSSVIRRLGLRPLRSITSRTMSNRIEKRRVFSPVQLEIQGRLTTQEVVELPDTLPNVVGQIPLEALDWVVDARRRKLIPNPEHKGGEHSEEFLEHEAVTRRPLGPS